jgi:adenylate cyclase
VSWLVREDLTVSAEENNFEVNRRASAETEQMLEKMRQLSLAFARTAALGERTGANGAASSGADRANAASGGAASSEGGVIQEEADYFFTQNPQIAALFYTSAGGASAWTDRVFVNERFFTSRGIETTLAGTYRAAGKKTLDNAAMGQTILVNASPWFNKTQSSVFFAALFFPIQNGGGCVLFSTETLNESFGMGVNASYLINAEGGIVADADPEKGKGRRESGRQRIYTPDNRQPRPEQTGLN